VKSMAWVKRKEKFLRDCKKIYLRPSLGSVGIFRSEAEEDRSFAQRRVTNGRRWGRQSSKKSVGEEEKGTAILFEKNSQRVGGGKRVVKRQPR